MLKTSIARSMQMTAGIVILNTTMHVTLKSIFRHGQTYLGSTVYHLHIALLEWTGSRHTPDSGRNGTELFSLLLHNCNISADHYMYS